MSVSVTHIDERLDELERLRVDMEPAEFLPAVIAALCDVVNASNVALVHPLNETLFVTIAVARHNETKADRDWILHHLGSRKSRPATSRSAQDEDRWIGTTTAARLHVETSKDASPSEKDDGRLRFGCSLSTTTWRYGGLVIQWPSNTEIGLERSVRVIIEAFAEIAYSHYLETFAETHQSRSRELIAAQNQLSDTADDDQSATVLVNAISSLLPADRVCLFSSLRRGTPRLLAVSGSDDFDRRTDEVKRIESAAAETSTTHQPRVFRQPSLTIPRVRMSDAATGVGNDCICLSIPWDEQHVLLMQWMSPARFASAVPWLHESCQSLQNTWLQTLAWHRVPRLMREHWKRSPRYSLARRFIKLATAIVLVGAMVVAAIWPIPFSIAGVGALEPTEQRWVFASQDGFVDELHVTSGQQVWAGDPIATLESTDLQIQITEVSGRIREVETQRQGIEITINQMVRSSTPDPSLENRLQAELNELAIRLRSLNEQAALLESEREALQIRSPIDGTIVGWEIERNLSGRPIRRGDVLLRVADKNASWRIELMIPDRDIGYLERFAAEVAPAPVVADYVLRAAPQASYQSELLWMSPEVVHDSLQGAAVEAHLSVGHDALQQAAFGATVDGRLMCGTRPRWFVWGRPIFEAIQRRLWF